MYSHTCLDPHPPPPPHTHEDTHVHTAPRIASASRRVLYKCVFIVCVLYKCVLYTLHTSTEDCEGSASLHGRALHKKFSKVSALVYSRYKNTVLTSGNLYIASEAATNTSEPKSHASSTELRCARFTQESCRALRRRRSGHSILIAAF